MKIEHLNIGDVIYNCMTTFTKNIRVGVVTNINEDAIWVDVYDNYMDYDDSITIFPAVINNCVKLPSLNKFSDKEAFQESLIMLISRMFIELETKNR